MPDRENSYPYATRGARALNLGLDSKIPHLAEKFLLKADFIFQRYYLFTIIVYGI